MRRRRHSRRRSGLTFLEVQVAFVVLGLALAGLCPLVVAQWKLTRRFESRFGPGVTYELVPASEEWSRKLGAAATLQAASDGDTLTLSPGNSSPANTVGVLSLERSDDGDRVTVLVSVQQVDP